MKFIITIDDAEKETIREIFIKSKLDYPIVVAVPAGLMGKTLGGYEVASVEILSEIIKEMNVEIASHGYYHIIKNPSFNFNKVINFKRVVHFPDKVDMIKRFIFYLCNRQSSTRLFKYDLQKEIVESKKYLQSILRTKVGTFIYPGGYVNREIANLVSKYYDFARTCEVGYNSLQDLRHYSRYLLKTISFSKYTNFNKIEKYYKKIYNIERNNEIVIIETFHKITKEDKTNCVYFTKFNTFIKHLEFITSLGEIILFKNLRGL